MEEDQAKAPETGSEQVWEPGSEDGSLGRFGTRLGSKVSSQCEARKLARRRTWIGSVLGPESRQGGLNTEVSSQIHELARTHAQQNSSGERE